MNDFQSRTRLLIGQDGVEKLSSKKILLFGVGGVGGQCAEALIRAGIKNLDIVDNDVVQISNINRQIFATSSNIGQKKVDVAKKRLLDINPDANINTYDIFYLPSETEIFDFKSYDYIIDAIDTVSAKIDLATIADKLNIRIISAMGAGNKLDPTRFEVADIYKTSVCPLAKVIRTELRKRKIKKLKVVYSKEEPIKNEIYDEQGSKRIPGSISFVPPVVGLIIAGEVIKDLIK